MSSDHTTATASGYRAGMFAIAGRGKRTVAAALLLTLAACSPAPDTPTNAAAAAVPAKASVVAQVATEERVLNFSNWTDYMPPGLLEDFERETGIKVNYRTYGSNEDLQKLVSMKAASDDLVVPSLNYGKTQAERGYYQPLDKALLPNYKNLDPEFLKRMARSDPGNLYFVPWAWGHTTLFANKTQIRKALGDLAYPENELDLVFNPAYTHRLKACGIAYVDSPSEIVPMAMHYLGLNPYSQNVADYQKAFEMLQTVRADIGVFNANIINVLSAGKTCVAIGWSGDINSAIATLKQAGNQDELAGLLPKRGTLMFVDGLVIPVAAKHPRNAHAFIDFYLRAKNSARMSNEIGYPNGNLEALAFVKPEIKRNPMIFPPDKFFSVLVPSDGYSDKTRWVMMENYVAFAFRIKASK
ncbi:MAG: extracellular solute-binding protein [Giesbergeria sp.]